MSRRQGKLNRRDQILKDVFTMHGEDVGAESPTVSALMYGYLKDRGRNRLADAFKEDLPKSKRRR